jgi:hypothetical protein
MNVVKVKWETRSVYEDDGREVQRLQAEGWEPFAVVARPNTAWVRYFFRRKVEAEEDRADG